MKLIVVLSVVALAAADVVPFVNCGSDADMATPTETDCSPWPPVKGQDAHVEVTGKLKESLTAGGTYSIVVSYMGIPVLSQTGDPCTLDPTKFTCPSGPGPVTLATTLAVPSIAPSGDFNVHVTAADPQGKQLLCLDVTLNIPALAEELSFDQCSAIIAQNKLSPNFNETIAHAVHSMTVDGLRLFNKDATTANNVPTVNQNIAAAQLVLPYAPEVRIGHDFNARTMNVIDRILSQLGKSDDGLGKHWSPLERIVHTFHMWDLWLAVQQVYEAEVLTSPPSADLCQCLTNVEANGVAKAVHWVADHYKSGTPITLLNRPIPKLEDSETWSIWRSRLLHYYTPQALRDAALYMYCATH